MSFFPPSEDSPAFVFIKGLYSSSSTYEYAGLILAKLQEKEGKEGSMQ